jgi:hypothetical protein
MSYSVTQVVQLATDIYQNIGSPSSLSVGFISGWLLDSGNLGGLNNKLSTSFYITGDANITDGGGNFGGEEADIYNMMYMSSFYASASLGVLAGGNSFWISVAEGDTKITRDKYTDIAKQYIAMKTDNDKNLRLAISDYKLRINVPQSVNFCPPYSYPSP